MSNFKWVNLPEILNVRIQSRSNETLGVGLSKLASAVEEAHEAQDLSHTLLAKRSVQNRRRTEQISSRATCTVRQINRTPSRIKGAEAAAFCQQGMGYGAFKFHECSKLLVRLRVRGFYYQLLKLRGQ